MDHFLILLLNRLEEIGEANREIYDSESRDKMSDAVINGFVRPLDHFVLPATFGLFSDVGNAKVHAAIEEYIKSAAPEAHRLGLDSPDDRLAAFQNSDIHTARGQKYFDDFFGYTTLT
jgi:hypothetical protein